jgi:two-component system NtrC family sensor kinase
MQLYILEGPDKGTFFPLTKNKFQLGRAPSNDIRVTDDKVSARHLLVEIQENTSQTPPLFHFIIKDLGSTNGTFLNGYQVQEVTLSLREKLLIGNTLLMFCTEEDQKNLQEGYEVPDKPAGNMIRKASSSKDTGVILEKMEDPSTISTDVQRASKRLNGLYRLLRLVHSSAEGETKLIKRIIECTLELLPAERCLAALLDPKTQILLAESVQKVTHSETENSSSSKNHGLSRTITKEVIEHKNGILSLDAREDYRFKNGDSVWGLNIRSIMCSPIMYQEQVLGILNLDSTSSGNFTEDDLELLNAIGREAGIAIQNCRFYEKAMHAEKLVAIGQAVASVSHYIKNILTGMKGGSYLVDNAVKTQDFSMLEKGWSLVKKSQDKISDLVLDMLNFSKHSPLALKLQDVTPLIEEVLLTIETNDRQKKIHIEKNLGKIPSFLFDAVGMHRCLLNIFYNAIDAMEEEGRLTVTTSQEQDKIVIRIQDSGCGIPENMKEKIFEIFVTTKGSKGTGIGLAVTRKIIQEHQGTIEVESEVGHGSCFILKFPLSPQKN